jgi:hypothetical protein
MQFRTLFTVDISHTYYSQSCKDFDFIIPIDTAQLLKNGKLIAKIREGKLYILFAVDDETGDAVVSLTGETLRIGLKLLNPFFSNFTNLDFDFHSSRALYQNASNPAVLNPAQAVTLVGQGFSHILTNNTRPITVTLKDASDRVVQVDSIDTTNDRSSIAYDLHGQVAGVYTITEADAVNTKTVSYYADLELQQQSIFGLIEIAIDDRFYTTPPEFTLSFSAKQETLKYYLVVKNYLVPDFDALSVLDAGEDGRATISFTKVLPAAFTNKDISPNLLVGSGDTKIVMFKSQTAVMRQEKARQKIQLKKNGVTIIPHLPNPGIDRANADSIVQLAKLKP